MMKNIRTKMTGISILLFALFAHADDSSRQWIYDVRDVPEGYPKLDGGLDPYRVIKKVPLAEKDAAEKIPSKSSSLFSARGQAESATHTHSSWEDDYRLAKNILGREPTPAKTKLRSIIEQIELHLCGPNRNKSALVIYKSDRIMRLISASLAVSADEHERLEGDQAKPCFRRIDHELRGNKLSGLVYVGTAEEEWNKVLQPTRFGKKFLWHLPQLMEVVGRGTHSGRDIGFESELSKAMRNGDFKIVGGMHEEQLGLFSEANSKGNELYLSFGIKLQVPDFTFEELHSLANHYIAEFEIENKIELQNFSYLHQKVERYLLNIPYVLDGIFATLERIRNFTANPEFKDEPLSFKTLNMAIGEVGSFPQWVLDESAKRKKFSSLKADIEQKMIGQREAISESVAWLQSGFLSGRTRPNPIASLLFVGSTGTGKTYLAERLSKSLYGRIAETIDMTQYTSQHSADRFVDDLAKKLKKSPYQVLVFEEIDKADVAVLDKLYFLLDEGRVFDTNQRSVSARGIVAICITNAAEKPIREYGAYKGKNDPSTRELKEIVLNALLEKFRESFIPRFSATPIFYPFSDDEFSKLAVVMIKDVEEAFGSKRWKLSVTPDVHEFASVNGRSSRFGARPMEKLISKIAEGGVTAYAIEMDVDLEDSMDHEFVIELVNAEESIFRIRDAKAAKDAEKFVEYRL